MDTLVFLGGVLPEVFFWMTTGILVILFLFNKLVTRHPFLRALAVFLLAIVVRLRAPNGFSAGAEILTTAGFFLILSEKTKPTRAISEIYGWWMAAYGPLLNAAFLGIYALSALVISWGNPELTQDMVLRNVVVPVSWLIFSFVIFRILRNRGWKYYDKKTKPTEEE